MRKIVFLRNEYFYLSRYNKLDLGSLIWWTDHIYKIMCNNQQLTQKKTNRLFEEH